MIVEKKVLLKNKNMKWFHFIVFKYGFSSTFTNLNNSDKITNSQNQLLHWTLWNKKFKTSLICNRTRWKFHIFLISWCWNHCVKTFCMQFSFTTIFILFTKIINHNQCQIVITYVSYKHKLRTLLRKYSLLSLDSTCHI